MTSRVNSNGFADFVEDVRALDSPFHAVTKHGASLQPYNATAPSSFLRTINRFTSAQVANSRLAFFSGPR